MPCTFLFFFFFFGLVTLEKEENFKSLNPRECYFNGKSGNKDLKLLNI